MIHGGTVIPHSVEGMQVQIFRFTSFLISLFNLLAVINEY